MPCKQLSHSAPASLRWLSQIERHQPTQPASGAAAWTAASPHPRKAYTVPIHDALADDDLPVRPRALASTSDNRPAAAPDRLARVQHGQAPPDRKAGDAARACSACCALRCRIGRLFRPRAAPAAPLARRQRRPLPWKARPAHAGPHRMGRADHSSSHVTQPGSTQPSSSPSDCPGRGHRVKGALRASHAIGVLPPLDPAAARQGMAAVWKMGGEQGPAPRQSGGSAARGARREVAG